MPASPSSQANAPPPLDAALQQLGELRQLALAAEQTSRQTSQSSARRTTPDSAPSSATSCVPITPLAPARKIRNQLPPRRIAMKKIVSTTIRPCTAPTATTGLRSVSYSGLQLTSPAPAACTSRAASSASLR